MIKKQREKQYAVFGLGRFGTSVALTLNELGYQVMGVDTDEDNVQRLAHELTHVVTADSSDERTLRSLGAQNFDVAVVAIGDLEANMLTTLLLKEIGVPVVVVKAINQVHGKMLIGVIHIFQKVHLLDDLFVSVFGACNQTTCLFRKVFLRMS